MLDSKLKIVFMGSSDFAVSSLQMLMNDEQFEILSVFTQPDRKVGRKRELKFTPVKEKALEYGLEIFQPEKSKEIYSILEAKDIDFIVVVAYGHIIRQKVIDLPKYDILNIHGSLLPAYRGASPIHAALAHGDKTAGVCVMRMVKELDAGPVYRCASTEILDQDDFASMHDKLANMGAELLPKVLKQIVFEGLKPTEQDDSMASFCAKITQEDAKIDFSTMSAEKIINMQKAYKYWPKLWFEFKDKKIKLVEFVVDDEASLERSPGEIWVKDGYLLAQTKTNSLKLIKIQPESKSIMLVEDFLRGNPHYFEKD